MTTPVYVSGVYINDDGELVLDADEMADAGVRSVELIEGEPEVPSYHNRIWNIPFGCDTRHAAAEIASDADRRIAELEAQLAEANAQIKRCEDCKAMMNPIGRGIFECWKCADEGQRVMSFKLSEQLKQAEARAEVAEKKAEHWMNRCQEVMAQLDSQCYLFMKLELEAAAECLAAAEARQEQATEQVVELRKALKVYANKAMWVKYERDDETTASLFIGNENGAEDGVLCDGWRFAQSALRQSEGE